MDDCPECDGTAVVLEPDELGRDHWVECPRCDGNGIVDYAQEREDARRDHELERGWESARDRD